MPKNANARTWGLAESRDDRRWSSYPRGEGPNLSSLGLPNNINGNENNLPYTVIRHTDPEADGLPMWGPSGQGVTVIRRVYVNSSPGPGYKAMIWYTRGDPVFDGGNWGFHPYPVGGGTSTTSWIWEIAAATQDITATRAGGTRAVTTGRWYLQALRMRRNSSSSRDITAWLDLPSTATNNIIDSGDLGSLGEGGLAATPQLVIGDSPWYPSYQNERFGGRQAEIKIIAKALSDSDCVIEATNMNVLMTPDAQNWIWWGKRGFVSLDDLTCDFGTNRAFTRSDPSSLMTLQPLA